MRFFILGQYLTQLWEVKGHFFDKSTISELNKPISNNRKCSPVCSLFKLEQKDILLRIQEQISVMNSQICQDSKKIQDSGSAGSNIQNLEGSLTPYFHLYQEIMEILDPAGATLLWDPRDNWSCFGKVSWNIADHEFWTKNMSLYNEDHSSPSNQSLLLVSPISDLLTIEHLLRISTTYWFNHFVFTWNKGSYYIHIYIHAYINILPLNLKRIWSQWFIILKSYSLLLRDKKNAENIDKLQITHIVIVVSDNSTKINVKNAFLQKKRGKMTLSVPIT